MISQEQALATAEGWLNPEGQERREVRMQEFDLGWVVWAAAPPIERDPVTGKQPAMRPRSATPAVWSTAAPES